MKNILKKQKMENIIGMGMLECTIMCGNGDWGFWILPFPTMGQMIDFAEQHCPGGWMHECKEI